MRRSIVFVFFGLAGLACGAGGPAPKTAKAQADVNDPMHAPVPEKGKFECVDGDAIAKRDGTFHLIDPTDKPALPARTVADKLAFAPTDHDGDGIDDEYDLCPASAEDGKEPHPFDGCAVNADQTRGRPTWPDVPRVVVKADRIEITEQIHFAKGSAKILDSSKPLIAAIAQAIIDNPPIELVEVAGHADKQGGAKDNVALTLQRAKSVTEALVARGVDKQWLRAMGYGEFCPVDPANTKLAFAKNRRVEFRIIKRDGKELTPWGGCAEAEQKGVKRPPPPPKISRPKPNKPVVQTAAKGAPDYHGSCRTRLPECEADCKAGSTEACYVGAHERNHSPEAPVILADREVLKKDCDAQLFPACSQLALSLISEPAQDWVTALSLASSACEKGDGFGCGAEAFLVDRGCSVSPDPATGYTISKKGCAIDIDQADDRMTGSIADRLSCAVASRSMWFGVGGAKDHAGAYALDLRACAAGLPHACIRLAQDAASDPSVITDRPKLVGTLHDICEQRGWSNGAEECVAMANIEKAGEYVSPRLCEAGGQLECSKKCEERDWEQCFDLYVANVYAGYHPRFDGLAPRAWVMRGLVEEAKTDHYKDSQAKLDEAAAEDYAKACTGVVPSGCVHHSRMRLEGRGTLRDVGGAADALEEWCDEGEKMACAFLGHAAQTKKIPGGMLEAKKRFAAACAAGLKWACKR